MGVRINTNIEAMNAQRYLGVNARSFASSVEKLSSGLRINHAADDAAGLGISERMTAQINGLNQATRNAQDGISMLQTADGALDQVDQMLQRMGQLATQAANDTLSTGDRANINTELQALTTEINNIAQTTTFNGKGLLSGSMVTTLDPTSGVKVNSAEGAAMVTAIDVSGAQGGKTYSLSSSGGSSITLTLGTVSQTLNIADIAAKGTESLNFSQLGVNLTLASSAGETGANIATALAGSNVTTAAGSGAANLQIGSRASDTMSISFNLMNISSSAGGALAQLNTDLTAFNGTQSTANAQALITDVTNALNQVNTQRAAYGADQNVLQYTVDNLGVASQNMTASNSSIRDVDLASEMVNFTKTQILQNAGTSILAQANQAPQSILKLLQ